MFVFRLKSFLITFLVALRTKTNKCAKNESGRARKALCCFNFLNILNLPINLNFVCARFEFDITSYYMAKCLCSQNLELLIITFLFCIRKRINVQNESERAICLLLGVIVVAVFICDCLSSKSWKNIRGQISDFFSKRFVFHETASHKIHAHEKNLTEKHHYALNPISNLRVIFFAAVFLASRLCVTSLNNGRKKRLQV